MFLITKPVGLLNHILNSTKFLENNCSRGKHSWFPLLKNLLFWLKNRKCVLHFKKVSQVEADIVSTNFNFEWNLKTLCWNQNRSMFQSSCFGLVTDTKFSPITNTVNESTTFKVKLFENDYWKTDFSLDLTYKTVSVSTRVCCQEWAYKKVHLQVYILPLLPTDHPWSPGPVYLK